MRLLLLIVLIVAAGAGALYLATLPGSVQVDAFGLSIRLKLVWATLILVLFSGIAAAIWGLIAGLWMLPGKWGKAREQSRMRKANAALAEGLLAAEAGDVSAAVKLARKAAAHAEDERLKVLLEARTAEASGDWISAERAWAQMARLPGGQMAGLRGTAAAAMERGDTSAAEASAREALALPSGADWPFNSLFDLQVSQGEWSKALETLAIGERKKLIAGDSLRRRRAVLQTAHAVSLPNDQRAAAQKALADALRAAPGFPPAAWNGARQLMLDKKEKAGVDVIELAWRSRPHPALSQLIRQMSAGDDKVKTKARLQRLIDANPDHYESKVLGAELAIQERDWVAAIKTLAMLVEAGPTGRLCLLMERALKGYGDSSEAARWARMAVTASREGDWSDLEPRGGAFNYSAGDWARLVYKFGDAAQLVHPRHEAFARELDVARAMAALPAPPEAEDADTKPHVKLPPGEMGTPLDYVPEDG
ncbi:MAG: heme biosynthesis HemY N-terminal domain-containing protein [Pseudomonadota bacterium]